MKADDFEAFVAEVVALLGRKLTGVERERARNAFSYRLPPKTLVAMIRSGR
jgi:hypothetical protein